MKKIKKIIDKLKFKNNEIGNVYCVLYGERTGQFLVFLKYDDSMKVYSVLTLPELEPIFINTKEIQNYKSLNQIEFVEKLSKNILKETITEYEYRISQVK